MLIKKLYYRLIRDFRSGRGNKFEIIGKFLFEYRRFYIIHPKNKNIISSRISYVIPEYPVNLDSERLKMLKSGILWYLMNDNKYRGRHYLIVLC